MIGSVHVKLNEIYLFTYFINNNNVNIHITLSDCRIFIYSGIWYIFGVYDIYTLLIW